MSQPQEKLNNRKNYVQRFLSVIREIVAILLWGYVIIKLLIFDIDILLIEKFSPNYIWIIQYKFFILLGILTVILLLSKNKHIVLWLSFIFFYPFILFFWRIPVLLLRRKSWNLIFAFIDSIVSFFKSFKFTFITTALFMISMVVILATSSRILLWLSFVILLAINFWVNIQKLISVFKPSSVYHIYTKIFSGVGEFVKFKPVPNAPGLVLNDEELSLPIEKMNEKQLQKWTTGVQWLALFNRVCLFIAKKIKAYQGSRFNIVASVFGILLLVLYTILSFSLLNLGLYKIDPNYFSFPSEPTFFNFIYYSFNNFLNNSIEEIIAKSPVAQATFMIEAFFALFLVGILVSLILSFRIQREADELNSLITSLNEEGKKAEEYLRDKYKLNTVEEAMQTLQKIDAIIADWLYKITSTIKD